MPPIKKIVKALENEALEYLDVPLETLVRNLKTLEHDMHLLAKRKDPRLQETVMEYGAALLAFLTRTIPEKKKHEFRRKLNAERERKRNMKKHKRCSVTSSDMDRIVFNIGRNPEDPDDPMHHMQDWKMKETKEQQKDDLNKE